MSKHRWRDYELEILKSGEWSDREIADMLGVTVHTVQSRRYAIKKAEAKKGKPTRWVGCNQTCPDFCPYDECLMPSDECAKSLKGVHSIAGERAGLRSRDDAPGSKPIPTVTLPTIVKRSI